jgi:hypothetical protein
MASEQFRVLRVGTKARESSQPIGGESVFLRRYCGMQLALLVVIKVEDAEGQ